MKLNQELFAIKLYEMEQEYAKLQSRLYRCGRENHQKIREELEKTKDEYKEQALVLKKSAQGSRSQTVAELAQAQLDYSRRMETLLQSRLGNRRPASESGLAEEQAEAVTLYAEYAIDLATQTMRYALIACLAAMDLQMDVDEQKGE